MERLGGAPLTSIEQLSGSKFKLLSIPESFGNKLAGVYKSATISYTNLKSGTIRTLAPEALILTRKYTRPAMVAPQAMFRSCFFEHLDDLKETPGKHPKWSVVNPDNKGMWDWYEMPSVSTDTVPSTSTSTPSRRR